MSEICFKLTHGMVKGASVQWERCGENKIDQELIVKLGDRYEGSLY